MDLKAGALSIAGGNGSNDLQFYNEELIETDEYRLERVRCGTKLTFRLLIKDANLQPSIELLPQGVYQAIWYNNLSVRLIEKPEGLFNTSSMQMRFNNLIKNDVVETLSIIAQIVGDASEFINIEPSSSSSFLYRAVNNQYPDVSSKPFILDFNSSGVVFTGLVRYEIILEANIHDK